MRSRLYHPPTLHAPHGHEGKKVTWLELFYDLVFVAGIIQLGNHLSDDPGLGGFALFALHFVPLWIAWSGFTIYENRFTIDDFVHRTLVLFKMFSVGVMAIASTAAMAGEPALFAAAYAVAQGIIALLYLRSWAQVPEARAYSRYWGSMFAIGAVAFGVSTLLPSPWSYALWAVGLMAILFAPVSGVSRALRDRYPVDMEHLSERYGLLTIIVLGESFVKVLSYLTGAGAEVTSNDLAQGMFNLTLTCCIWWVYFDDIAGSHVRKGRATFLVWLYSHLPLTLAITAVGVALKKAIAFDLAVPAPDKYRWLLAGSLALTFFSVAIIDSVTERRVAVLSDRARVGVRTTSALVVLLLGQIGAQMSAGVFLGLVAAMCVGQVLFDMMMAPLEESEEHVHATSTTELARRGARASAYTQRRKFTDAVRKGAPSELRRDMYFFLIEGSWARLLLSLGFLYGLINVVFAGLYLFEPGSVTGGANADFSQATDFSQAFFFSVQTLSTIGYGALLPGTAYGDLLVTIEAATGMLFVALATGVTFAKASRPRAAVLFSECAVIHTRHGQRVFSYRAANARGNEMVEAQMRVSVLRDEISPEGHHLRRVIDLPLVRERSPAFLLSWVVFHVIDEDSPLQGVDFTSPDCPILAIIVTLMGHDGTYGQTTHARHTYYPPDVRQGHSFVDVMHQLDDGRMLLDLTVFHHTVPQQADDAAEL